MPSPDSLARVLQAQRIRRTVTARLAEQRRHDVESAWLVAALVLLIAASIALILVPVILR